MPKTKKALRQTEIRQRKLNQLRKKRVYPRETREGECYSCEEELIEIVDDAIDDGLEEHVAPKMRHRKDSWDDYTNRFNRLDDSYYETCDDCCCEGGC